MAYQLNSGQEIKTFVNSISNSLSNLSGNSIINGVLNTTSDGPATRLYIDTYNSSSVFSSSLRGRRHRGTIDNPSKVLKDDVLLQIVGDGYNGSGYNNAVASIILYSAEDFASGSNGSYIRLRTTPIGSNSQLERLLINSEGLIGISNSNPLYTLDVSGSGNFTEGVGIKYLSLTKQITTPLPINNEQTSLYFNNQAKRSILTYANERGIGKNIQNTLFAENVNIFVPNTTTSMVVFGTTATNAGTLSHPTTFTDLTRDGYATNFATAATSSSPAGLMSNGSQFYLTSGVTGLGAGFYYAAQFSFPDNSGLYAQATGITTGIRFFAGMTDGTTSLSTVNQPWPTQALIGFQLNRASGVSGRFDDNFKFVTKDNGASAPFYIQETNCPFKTGMPYYAYIYGRSDFRNGIHWMITTPTDVYTGDFTGNYGNLPLVSSSVQRMLRPTISFQNNGTVARNIKTKGMYCETV